MVVTKEGILVASKDGVPVAVIRRDEKSGHQVIYLLSEAGAEDLEALLKQNA